MLGKTIGLRVVGEGGREGEREEGGRGERERGGRKGEVGGRERWERE